MKRIMCFILIVSMLSMSVLAANGQGNGILASNQNQESQREQVQVKGLEKAVVQVKYNDTVQHLEQVAARIQEQTRTRLNNLENLVLRQSESNEYGDFIAEGDGEGKLFGLFKMRRHYQYWMSYSGEVSKVPKWYDFMWREAEE